MAKRFLLLLALAALGASLVNSRLALAGDAAGCGLGHMLFEGQSGMVPNVLAATTNGTVGSQTFGITSGTSGCKADSVVLKDQEQQMFVEANLSVLSQEMAQGQGQHVTALAALMGCPAAEHAQFAQWAQASYSQVFSQADATAPVVLTNLRTGLARQPALAASCTRLT